MNLAEFDVIIVGGGAAGVGAAIGARQANAEHKILLIEAEACLGGAATHRGVVSYCGLFTIEEDSRRAVGGVWDELCSRLLKLEGTDPHPMKHRGIFQVVEPEPLKVVLDEMLADHGIVVLLHTTVVAAKRTAYSTTLASIEIQEKHGRRRTISANAFVDCSGDCDLAFHAQASTRYGNNGAVNLGSLSTRWGGLQDASPTAQQWREAVQAAKRADPRLESIIPKDSSVLIRLPRSRDICTYMASAVYDARSSESVTLAEQSGRRQAQKYLQILRALPGHDAMYLVSTGPNFGTRESRHITARYQLREADIAQGRRFDDVIALGAWAMEWHDSSRKDWSSSFALPPGGCFDIPLGCLCSVDTPNLFAAGRCVDGDQYAGSSIRVMGTALATGQAAGVAAGLLCMQNNNSNSELLVAEVQRVLKLHGALLDRDHLPKTGFVGSVV